MPYKRGEQPEKPANGFVWMVNSKDQVFGVPEADCLTMATQKSKPWKFLNPEDDPRYKGIKLSTLNKSDVIVRAIQFGIDPGDKSKAELIAEIEGKGKDETNP